MDRDKHDNPSSPQQAPHISAVVIGRNEGDRLVTCLESLLQHTRQVVYVDSGSKDQSIENALSRGVRVEQLDTTTPFTAARARNIGWRKALQDFPDCEYIQFIDGDCELNAQWLPLASDFLTQNRGYAIACGRRRERYPHKTCYNELCDIEWNTPVGDALACGGDALVRVAALTQVGGYNPALIAGEEPEMCFRLRQQGWKIRRMDMDMTLHDANMTTFSQWWRRNQRAGYAYMIGYHLHGKSPEKFKARELKGILLWTVMIPLVILALSAWLPFALLSLLIYPLQIIRLFLRYRLQFHDSKPAMLYGAANVVGKFAQITGVLRFFRDRLTRRNATLIEYK